MLLPNQIADKIEQLLRERFPGENVHRDLCPQGFKRPCNLIVQEPFKGDLDVARHIVTISPVFTITTFVEVDEYHHSHLYELHTRQMAIVGLFMPGYLKVGDRAPKVEGLTMGGGYDFDTVTVTFGYTLDRGEFENLEQLPIMEHLHLTEEVRTYG